MFDVVILSDHRYINPRKKNWYINQVLLENNILKDSLKRKGLKVCIKNWSDKKFDWTKTKSAIFRTTWDYFERFNEFFDWIEKTKDKTLFINSLEVIKWNLNKYYLKDLIVSGINIPSTKFLQKGTDISLKKLFQEILLLLA